MLFDIELSDKYYEGKIDKSIIGTITFHRTEVDIDSLSYFIQQGYAYCSVMENDYRNRDNFVSTHFITYDIDDCGVEMDKCVDALTIKPSIAYTTPSNGMEGKGYRYRLLYCLEEPITDIPDYFVYSHSLSEQLQLSNIVGKDCLDDKSWWGEQYWNGSRGCHLTVNYNILKKEDILVNTIFYKDYIDYIDNHPVVKRNKSATRCIRYTPQHNTSTCTFEDDYWNLSYNGFLNKYDYPNIEHSPIEFDEDTPIIDYPNDYYEITRPFRVNDNGYIKKITDGEKRRKKLYLNGIIRRKINPNISFDNLLYNLVYEFHHYYVNNGNKITKREIFDIAANVMNSEIRDSGLGRPKNKSFANPFYCKKYDMTPNQVMGMRRNKKQYIGEFYDFTKTDPENIEIMKEYGLEISTRTLKTWKKENGIRKYGKRK